eukprot:TRINITY_DN5933_c0_g2_i1.p1 TRINITY_DN5933_c0_g2~~TRINITY_DN5933_c0_g2_i1.p1  ORF type:complete len:297 (+),score=30.41 TRINITY_DN5933_c0_g2_i1:236-1126(+)
MKIHNIINLVLFTFSALCLRFTHASVTPLNITTVHLVDFTNYTEPHQVNNYLFRGNQPMMANGTFDYKLLRQYLTIRAKQEGNLQLPQNYFLLDISFLTAVDPSESGALFEELSFFNAYPNLGALLNWPLWGDLMGPYNFTLSLRILLAESLTEWQYDDIPQKITYIRQILLNGIVGTNLPLVIYLHGGEGKDRTSEIAASYTYRYKNESFQTVWNWNQALGLNDLDNENAMMWYCEYLAYEVFGNDPNDCNTVFDTDEKGNVFQKDNKVLTRKKYASHKMLENAVKKSTNSIKIL